MAGSPVSPVNRCRIWLSLFAGSIFSFFLSLNGRVNWADLFALLFSFRLEESWKKPQNRSRSLKIARASVGKLSAVDREREHRSFSLNGGKTVGK